ncbi:MAG: DUF92 domain-containing protein [Candidatus Micrarchaeota archaeon]|nr:DUF92 domain-containing protein [Candidatus Micrarchaeota archaeon]
MPNPLLLDFVGLTLAILFGLIVLIFGSTNFFIIFLIFLVLSVAVTRYGSKKKRENALYEHERSWENVLSNGLVPTSIVFLPYFGLNPIGAYIGSVAAITADKFASELGVLGPPPIDLATLKKARNGQSGCISSFGTFMSFVGALIIGLFAHFLFFDLIGPWKIFTIAFIGLFGSLADSLAGVLEEKGIGNKSTSNLVCSLVGAILGLAFI